MITQSVKLLQNLQYPSGLFAAAAQSVKTGYSRAWLRDNVYAALGLEAVGNYDAVIKTYRALLEVLKKHEYKIDWMIKEPMPKAAFRYIHARYDPVIGDEIKEEWGNKQNDAIGAILFKIGELVGKGILQLSVDDKRVVQKLVSYLAAIEYWKDSDNGMWEENEEVHASSVGACVAGLQAVKGIVVVPEVIIQKGRDALNALLPRESETKETDLALLSLIYPYNIVGEKQRNAILKNVEEKLLREKGVIRYAGDKYYNKDGEAEWTMGLAWLAIIYKQLGIANKHKFFLDKTQSAMNEQGELPELYFANTSQHNENTPLGWAQSLFVVAAA